MSRNDRFETLAILVDQGCVSGGNFLTSLVLARTLEPSLYGRFSLLLLFLYAINTCHSSLVVYPLVLRAANGDSKDLASASLVALTQTALLALPLGIACVAFCLFSGELKLALGLVAAMVAWQLQETVRRALLSSRNALKAILPDLFCFVGQGVLLLLFKPRTLSQILGVIVGTSVFALLWQSAILRLSAGSIASFRQNTREAWAQGKHILGGNGFNMIALQLPSWTLAFFGGAVAVAGYQSLLNLAGIANPIIFSVNTALIPTVARSAGSGYLAARKTALQVGLQYGALLLPCFVALGVAPVFIMKHVYGAGTPYLALAHLLPIFITAYAIQYVATVIGAYEGGMSRPQTYFRVQAFSTVALAVLALPLVPLYGVRGAVYAVLGFSVMRVVLFALYARHYDSKLSATPVAGSEQLESTSLSPLTVAVCLLTYKRPEMLKRTLTSLSAQSMVRSGAVSFKVIVVDNDGAQSGKSSVLEAFADSSVPFRYVVNEANGLSTGRNLALEAADAADYVAFIDDDEVAQEDWLEQMLRTAVRTGASVVTGPVDPILDGAPAWVRDGGFFAPNEHPSGTLVPHAATNNTLVSRTVFTQLRFDPSFDRTGGEDTDYFLRARAAGHSIVWCNEGRVQEWIPLSRANEVWILSRAQSDANRYTRGYLRLNGGTVPKVQRLAKAAAGMMMGVSLAPFSIAGTRWRVRARKHIARATGTLQGMRGHGIEDYAGSTSDASKSKVKIPVVVVGQTPPPLNGQTIMIREFVQGAYDEIAITYVPMKFSKSTAEVGRLDWRKPFVLISTIVAICNARRRSGASILYYPPAGANLVPVLRDIILLLACRPLFQKTVFHFHAAGLSQIYPKLPSFLRGAFRRAYQRPDLAIFTTEATSSEAAFLHAKVTSIVPCGAPEPQVVPDQSVSHSPVVTILFAGIVCEKKGVMTLLRACTQLKSRALPFRLNIMGAFQSPGFEREARDYLQQHGLDGYVTFLGQLSGLEKDTAFARADIFCFPSHYPAESFGVVLIEAMSHGLPIVATDWQGIPEVTGRDGNGSILVPVRSPDELAASLMDVLSNPARREAMGRYNRTRYLERFTLSMYRQALSKCIAALHHLSPCSF